MTAPVRAGLIGCGSLSLIGILPQLAEPDAKERVELVAVCDVNETRARETAERFGVTDAYSDPQDLIARDDIDLVLVITPIEYHYPLTMDALRAGKHVYVQKTMATTYAEAREMIETARERGLTLVAAPGQMLAPAMRAMKQLVSSGALGDVYWAWGSTGGWYHDEPTRRGEGALGAVDPTWYYRAAGGPLRDVTVYMLHSLTGVLGPAQRVTAMSGIRNPMRQWRDKAIPVEVDDNSLLLLDFGGATYAMAGGHASLRFGRGHRDAGDRTALRASDAALNQWGRRRGRNRGPGAAGRRHVRDGNVAAIRDRGPRQHPGASRLCRHPARGRLHRARGAPARLRRAWRPRGRDHREGLSGGEDRCDPGAGEPLLEAAAAAFQRLSRVIPRHEGSRRKAALSR
ncbi:MAG: oxidoreductase domain protein [Thermomicrobiales bacterium]|nr:oxidoreductase domain protein [Thermomicrobiales bacterium]